MRNSFFAFAAIGLLFFTSCDKDISVENSELSANPTKPATENASNLSNCKDCSYVPVCSGSVYRYSDTSAGSSTGTIQSYTLKYLKDTMIAGRTYQKILGAGQQAAYFNCSSGISSTIVLSGAGGNAPYTKTTNLKANQSVGHNWADVINNATGQPVTHSYTIMSKGNTRTVAGITYTDVIHVHERNSLNMPNAVIMPIGRTDYYFAKGTGLVESISLDDFSGQKIFHHVLLSATIPN
ncbi:MAG: hypothetical protein WKF88_03855 [Ferruginibacter sp.]